MKSIIILILTSFSITTFAQEQKFISEILIKNKSKSVYVVENYIIDYYVEVEHFNRDNFKLWWSEIETIQTPSIDTFFVNFDLNQLQSDLISNKRDSVINFKNLDTRIKKITKDDIVSIREEVEEGNVASYRDYPLKVFLNISKPIFNSSKNWAIIIKSTSNPYLDTHSGGELFIYRYKNCEWSIYHKFHLWFN